MVLGAAIAVVAVVPMAFAAGAVVPSGPVWVLLAVIVAVFAMVWPASLLAGRLALRPRPIEAIAQP
jgi:putative ABC transport system permease protein